MELAESISMLTRTPSALQPLLTGLPDEWVHRNDGAGTWSAYDIVGHLALADGSNWIPRLRTILEHGTAQPFGAFDREAMLRRERQPITALLAEFAQARQASLAALALTESDMDRRGLHPALGEVTVGQLIASWVAHDLTHLAQVGEVLARRYRDDVGPWRVFMPALDRVAEAE